LRRKGNRKRKAFRQHRNRFSTLRAFHFAESEKWGKMGGKNWASQTKQLRKGKHKIALATHGAYPVPPAKMGRMCAEGGWLWVAVGLGRPFFQKGVNGFCCWCCAACQLTTKASHVI